MHFFLFCSTAMLTLDRFNNTIFGKAKQLHAKWFIINSYTLNALHLTQRLFQCQQTNNQTETDSMSFNGLQSLKGITAVFFCFGIKMHPDIGMDTKQEECSPHLSAFCPTEGRVETPLIPGTVSMSVYASLDGPCLCCRVIVFLHLRIC